METNIFGSIAEILEATDNLVRVGCEQLEKQVVYRISL